MKILILKKHYIFYFSIFFTLSLFLFFYLYSPFSLAISLTTNSDVDENLQEKISALAKSDEKIAYLTFDDGPHPKVTPKVLDILKEEEVTATFFVIGKQVSQYPDITKRTYEEGHFIANHGYSHNNRKLYRSNTDFVKEIKDTDMEIAKAIGVADYSAHIFRFPNGYHAANYKQQKKEAAKLLAELNYVYIDWNSLNQDSLKKYSNYQLLNNLKKSVKNKGTLIVLMHDTSDVSDSSLVLKDSISFLKSEGYEFRNFYDFLNQ